MRQTKGTEIDMKTFDVILSSQSSESKQMMASQPVGIVKQKTEKRKFAGILS